MNNTMALATLTGLFLGAGLWLTLVRLPLMRRTSFTERIEPQLRSLETESRLLKHAEVPTFVFGPVEPLMRIFTLDVRKFLGRFNIGATALARRLQLAGREESPLDFRASQLVWVALGLLLGIVAALFSVAAGKFNLPMSLLGCLALAVGGFLLKDYLLGARIKSREAKMLAEFPALAELMALAVGAGESATGALERVTNNSSGELSKDFSGVLARTRSGVPLVEALTDYSRVTRLPPLARFMDGIIVAVSRGTPLADVLRAQAQDVRDMAKRELMESAGKKEIGMMIPVVFGVLPLTVIFAVFPGLALLNIGT